MARMKDKPEMVLNLLKKKRPITTSNKNKEK